MMIKQVLATLVIVCISLAGNSMAVRYGEWSN